MHLFKNIIILLTLSFSFLQTSLITAEILEIREIDSVRNFVDKDSVVFFNVTDTVFKPSTTMFSYGWRQYFLKRIDIALMCCNSSLGCYLPLVKSIPIEETTSQIIAEFQENEIPVFGILHEFQRQISRYDVELKGIDFNKSFNYVGSRACSRHSDFFNGSDHFNGILFNPIESLYIGLDSFLDVHGLTGKNIVVVESSENSLKKFEEMLSKKGIVFTGLRYINEYNQNFDKTLGNIQFPIFIDENRIISDEEAKQIQAENPAVDFEKKLAIFIRKQHASDANEEAKARRAAQDLQMPFFNPGR